jgi:hypothetical protein
MKHVFAVALAAACVVGSTPSFARGGFGHGGGFRGGFVRNPTTLLGSPAPRMPAFQNRIPAPLAAPTQPPVTGRRRGAHMEGSCSAPCLVGVVRDHRANSRCGALGP